MGVYDQRKIEEKWRKKWEKTGIYEPFDSAQGRPFGLAQGKPFDSAQGRPFDSAQGRPFDSAQGRPDLRNAKRPFYNLMMFPYPSAEGLHVGDKYAFHRAAIY